MYIYIVLRSLNIQPNHSLSGYQCVSKRIGPTTVGPTNMRSIRIWGPNFPNFPPILTMSSTSPSTQMIHLPTARYPRCCERLRQKNNSCCCLMGILTMAYYNPTQVGSIMPYIPYTTSFFHCSSRNHCELSINPKVLTASKQMTARRHI